MIIYHHGGAESGEVATLVEELCTRYPIDETAILLTGPSMAGAGTWHIAARFPGPVTAGAPVCGGGDPLQAAEVARFRICGFHGARDHIAPVERSTEMVQAVRGVGGEV